MIDVGNYTVDDFYKEEFNRIPGMFRFPRRLAKPLLKIMIALSVIDFIILAILPTTRKIVSTGFYFANGSELYVATYNLTLFIVFLALLVVLLLIVTWLVLCNEFEKKAFRTASVKYAQYSRDFSEKTYEMFKDYRRKNGADNI